MKIGAFLVDQGLISSVPDVNAALRPEFVQSLETSAVEVR